MFNYCYLVGKGCPTLLRPHGLRGACEAPLSMGFLRKEYWSELPFLYLGDISDQGIKPESLEPSILAGELFTTEPPGKLQYV